MIFCSKALRTSVKLKSLPQFLLRVKFNDIFAKIRFTMQAQKYSHLTFEKYPLAYQIGLAVGDIESIQKNAELKLLAIQVR